MSPGLAGASRDLVKVTLYNYHFKPAIVGELKMIFSYKHTSERHPRGVKVGQETEEKPSVPNNRKIQVISYVQFIHLVHIPLHKTKTHLNPTKWQYSVAQLR